MSLVVGGGRLEVPPRGALPGADTPTFTGLEAYLALMRRCWAQVHAFRLPGCECSVWGVPSVWHGRRAEGTRRCRRHKQGGTRSPHPPTCTPPTHHRCPPFLHPCAEPLRPTVIQLNHSRATVSPGVLGGRGCVGMPSVRSAPCHPGHQSVPPVSAPSLSPLQVPLRGSESLRSRQRRCAGQSLIDRPHRAA